MDRPVRGANGNPGQIARGLICGGYCRVLGIRGDEPSRMTAWAGDAASCGPKQGLDDLAGFPAAGAIDQHGLVECLHLDHKDD